VVGRRRTLLTRVNSARLERPAFDLRQQTPGRQALNAGVKSIMPSGDRETRMKMLIAATAMMFAAGVVHAQGADVAGAEALMKKSGCFKCHSVSAKKDGPSFKSVAEKYKGKPDAESALYKHLTTGPTVKIDGKEERHEVIKTKNDAEIKNVIAYILSR
jgi:cytochrome c